VRAPDHGRDGETGVLNRWRLPRHEAGTVRRPETLRVRSRYLFALARLIVLQRATVHPGLPSRKEEQNARPHASREKPRIYEIRIKENMVTDRSVLDDCMGGGHHVKEVRGQYTTLRRWPASRLVINMAERIPLIPWRSRW